MREQTDQWKRDDFDFGLIKCQNVIYYKGTWHITFKYLVTLAFTDTYPLSPFDNHCHITEVNSR